MKVSIIIPVYNSEETIGPLVELLVSSLGARCELEVVLVDDGSRDGSEAACDALCDRHPGVVKFLSLSKNFGEHNAVMAGLGHCRGDYAVIMDDDFQNPIDAAAALIDAAIAGGDDVVYTYYEKKHHSPFRNFGSWFNDKVANVMLDKPPDLYLSSFKIMNRFLIDAIVKYDLPYPYIDGLVLRSTNKIGRLKVRHEDRAAGRSGYTLVKLASLWLNMFTNFSVIPLRAATVIGMSLSGLGLLGAAVTVYERLAYPGSPPGYAAILVSVLVFSGAQLIAIGLVGEYVGRVFLSLSKMPQYHVRKKR